MKYTHTYSPGHIKAINSHSSRTIGHLEAIRKVVERDKDCSDILIQPVTVKAAISDTVKAILEEHLAHCMYHAVMERDTQGIEGLNKTIDMFVG